MSAPNAVAAAAGEIRPSPVFFGVVALTVVFGARLWLGRELVGLGVFLFVVAGWVLSLTLHEFGHAIVAYLGGDRSVADKGYLTLDVRKYADPGTSLLLPILLLVVGGIALPGGAVWINHRLLRSEHVRSAMSAAGPAASLLCGIVCLVPLRLGLFDSADPLFAVAIGFLGWIQIVAFVLNMIPIPGLDGFGIIEPYLSPELSAQLQPLRQYGFFILIACLWFVAPIRDVFWDMVDWLTAAIGGDGVLFLSSAGWSEFRFWVN